MAALTDLPGDPAVLRDLIEQIDRGEIAATNVKRAFLAGALAALESQKETR